MPGWRQAGLSIVNQSQKSLEGGRDKKNSDTSGLALPSSSFACYDLKSLLTLYLPFYLQIEKQFGKKNSFAKLDTLNEPKTIAYMVLS